MRVLPLVVAAGCLAVACGAPRDATMRRQRLAAERRNLERTLDRLEDRLVTSQARVRFWQEMRTRHESVTAVACGVQGRHALEMARYHELQEQKRSSLHRARVASARPVPGDAAAVPAVTDDAPAERNPASAPASLPTAVAP